MLHFVVVLAPLFLVGCATLNGPPFVPYTVHIDAVVAEEPETLVSFVREAVAGTVIVGDAPAPPDAQYVARLRPHPAGTQLRIERRLTKPGFFDGMQLMELYRDVVRPWAGDENGYVPPHRARLVPQTSATTCITDTTATGLAPPPDYELEDEVWSIVDEPPELIGGLRAVQKRIRYPKAARRNGTEGVVLVQFIVDERGEVPCADVVLGLPFGANEEVLTAVQDMEFKAGYMNGEPVKVRFALPVRFRLR